MGLNVMTIKMDHRY